MASRGINKAIILGTLGNDPEVRYTQAGKTVTTISLATSETWKDKQTGQPQERTEWHRVVLFDRLGEIAGEYLRKGQKTYIEGQIRTRKWQDKEGQDRYTTEIVARDLQLLTKPQGGGQQGGTGSGPAAGSQANAQTAGQRSGPDPAKAPPTQPGEYDNFDDDIPF